MQCPFCKAEDTRVVDSRVAKEGEEIRRRRECGACKNRFTTFEKADLHLPQLIKRGGTPEPFDEDKLRKGLDRALHKRPVRKEDKDQAIDNVKRRLRQIADKEVDTSKVGEFVMDELHELDHVAYVRFASIYHEFKDAHEFRDEVERLLSKLSAKERKSQLSLIADDETAEAPQKRRKGAR